MELFVLDVVCPLLLWHYICSSLPETSSSSHASKNLPLFISFCLAIIKHHKKGWHKNIFGLLKPMNQIYLLFHLTNHSNLLIVPPTAFRFYEHQITASFFPLEFDEKNPKIRTNKTLLLPFLTSVFYLKCLMYFLPHTIWQHFRISSCSVILPWNSYCLCFHQLTSRKPHLLHL